MRKLGYVASALPRVLALRGSSRASNKEILSSGMKRHHGFVMCTLITLICQDSKLDDVRLGRCR